MPVHVVCTGKAWCHIAACSPPLLCLRWQESHVKLHRWIWWVARTKSPFKAKTLASWKRPPPMQERLVAQHDRHQRHPDSCFGVSEASTHLGPATARFCATYPAKEVDHAGKHKPGKWWRNVPLALRL